jgi:hypothetical protein
MLTPLDQPIDPLDDMTEEEAEALKNWEQHFKVSSPSLERLLTCRRNIYLWELLSSLGRNNFNTAISN